MIVAEEQTYMTLQELQQVSLGMLLEFDDFCKRHDIRYALCGGTMLGAARHKGFIPWDDDIDLMMTRDQYEKLIECGHMVAQENNLRQLISCRDKTFSRDYARYVSKEYGKKEEGVTDTDCPWVGIDIFPIDDISDNQDEFVKQIKDRVFWREVFVACSSPFNAGSTFVKRWVRNIFRPFAFMIGRFRAAAQSEKICRRFENCGGSDIAIVCGMYGERERWPRTDYEPLITLPFEGHEMPVPHDYVRYLSGIYGEDFMAMPPEEKRRPPHITAWHISADSTASAR